MYYNETIQLKRQLRKSNKNHHEGTNSGSGRGDKEKKRNQVYRTQRTWCQNDYEQKTETKMNPRIILEGPGDTFLFVIYFL